MNSSPQIVPVTEVCDWQQLLRNTVNDPAELLRLLELPASALDGALAGAEEFPLRVPRPFIERMRKGDLNDPLLRQVLPVGQETLEVPGYVSDPLAEASANPTDGLIHKYQGRVLLILSGACAVNCRYCFRRHFPYQDNRLGSTQWQQVLQYLRTDRSISEVIFSGGDPLAVADARLDSMLSDLEQIPHLRRLRIHTRLPVVIPQRVSTPLLNRFRASRFKPVMVLHINHPQEIDGELTHAVAKLREAGVTVLNQAVLLRGINDQVDILAQLSEILFESGILPYYLFTFDPVKGAAHFDVPDQQAQQLFAELQARLPGYLVPKLAREIPDRPSKTLLLPTTS